MVDKEALVIEQTMAYLRECHGYQMTLTGRVVALNLAALAAYGVILSSSPVDNLKTLPDLLLVAFGFLVTAFGAVFNWGASAAQRHLLRTQTSLKKYINDWAGEEVASRPGYKEIMSAPESGRVANLTIVFLFLCSFIWQSLPIWYESERGSVFPTRYESEG